MRSHLFQPAWLIKCLIQHLDRLPASHRALLSRGCLVQVAVLMCSTMHCFKRLKASHQQGRPCKQQAKPERPASAEGEQAADELEPLMKVQLAERLPELAAEAWPSCLGHCAASRCQQAHACAPCVKHDEWRAPGILGSWGPGEGSEASTKPGHQAALHWLLRASD